MRFILLLFLSICFISACGGGGGSGSGAGGGEGGDNNEPPTNQAPDAGFAADPTSGNPPLVVSFNASTSSDSDGSIDSYAWTFGDGTTGSGRSASHTYASSGTFTVELMVTDDNGATDTLSSTITVTNSAEVSGSAAVSGVLSAFAGMFFDSDTNDINADYTANDTVSEAQEITAPATVGGYLNVAGEGEPGRSRDGGDISDYYRVSLVAGQTVSLRFADAAAANLDLYVYDSAGDVTPDVSAGTGTTETLSVSRTAIYYIEARAVSGASTYTLFIGQGDSAAGPEELHLGDDFIPGEVIVKFGSVAAASLDEKARRIGLQGLAGNPGRAMRMGFRHGVERQEAFSRLGIDAEKAGDRVFVSQAGDLQTKWDTLEVIRALRRRSDVVYAGPNYRIHSTATPNDPDYGPKQAWHYEMIDLPSAWDAATGNDSVIVAVVDTGVLLNHPDLDGRIVDGYDFIGDLSSSNDGDGIDDNPDDPGDDIDGGSSFHGTHVAGIIAAATNNGTGVAGVTWTGKVMPIRVLGVGGGTTYDVMQGVRFAAGLDNDSGTLPIRSADIINLSLGGGGYSAIEQDLYTELHDTGIIVVAAAGNGTSDDAFYPAAYDDVISVSAVAADKSLASYSNYGSTIDVAAPGGDDGDFVYSTLGDDDGFGAIAMIYGGAQGTSMATPHVAGVAALMKGASPSLTPDDFDALLQAGTIVDDLGDVGRDDRFGYGLINAREAVDWALSNQAIPTTLVVSPDSLNFGSLTTSRTMEITQSGSASVGTVDIDVSATWLAVTAETVDSAGLGTYTVTVDRSGLPEGTYSGTITASATGVDDVEVEVTVEVGFTATTPATPATSGGFHYLVLLDPDTLEVRYQVSGMLEGGELAFEFTAVDTGTYLLYAGTDMDNDGQIGGANESFGAYPTHSNPVPVNVSTDQVDLDFQVEFNTVSQFTATDKNDSAPSIRRLSSTKTLKQGTRKK